MKNILIRGRFWGCILIALTSCNWALAEDLFSYVSIQLPYQPQQAQPWAELITTQEQWNSFYARNFVDSTSFPPKPVPSPAIDFSLYRVVVGGLGLKPSSGYSLIVNRLLENSADIYMEVLDVGSGVAGQICGGNTMITYPYLAVLVKKIDKPIRIKVVKATTDCN